MINEPTLCHIKALEKKYKDTWGKEPDMSVPPNGITQEDVVICLELMIADNISLLVAYERLCNKS